MTRSTKSLVVVLGAAAASMAGTTGCTIQTGSGGSDASRYLDPIPHAADVAIGVPAGSTTSGATAQSRIRTDATPTGAGPASYYVLTREVTDAVDGDTAAVLGTVWLIVNLPPTSQSAHQAVWGPMHDALSPVTWRLTVTESGTEVYDYELDGRPATSTSDADYQAVLTGVGYGRDLPQHRTGWFQWNADVRNALDPVYASGSGTTKVTFDLTTLPATIAVDQQASVHTTIAVSHESGDAGQVLIGTQSDLKGDGVLENVTMNSRWAATGAGRADAQLTGGDLGPTVVTVSQCWAGATFAAVYYTDSAGIAPTTGDAAACAFPQGTF